VTSSDSTQTDRLLKQAQAGDRQAMDSLFAAHRAYLRCVIDLHMDDQLRKRVDASDVIQETQLEAAHRIQDYLSQPTVSFRIWLRQTALEQLINHRRRHVIAQKRSVRREVQLSDQSSFALAHRLLEKRPSEIVRREELAQQVREAVASMGEADREMILLRHIEELTNQEVSEVLEIDAGTASKRYGRALRRFREKLKDLDISRSR
jgi:RNA polymerase sigma-70 factor (ECF subfamily)